MNNQSTTAQYLANRAPVSARLSDDHSSLIVNTVEIPMGSDHVVNHSWAINLATGHESAAPEVDLDIKKYAPNDEPVVVSPNKQFLLIAKGRGSTVDVNQPYRWTRPIRHFDALSEIDNPPQLQVVDVSNGDKRWITDDDWRWSSVRWSPNNDCVFACRSLDPDGRDGYQYA